MPHLARQLTYLTDMEEENYHAADKRKPQICQDECRGVAWGEPEFTSTFSQPSVCKTETAWPQTDSKGFQDVRGSNFEHS